MYPEDMDRIDGFLGFIVEQILPLYANFWRIFKETEDGTRAPLHTQAHLFISALEVELRDSFRKSRLCSPTSSHLFLAFCQDTFIQDSVILQANLDLFPGLRLEPTDPNDKGFVWPPLYMRSAVLGDRQPLHVLLYASFENVFFQLYRKCVACQGASHQPLLHDPSSKDNLEERDEDEGEAEEVIDAEEEEEIGKVVDEDVLHYVRTLKSLAETVGVEEAEDNLTDRSSLSSRPSDESTMTTISDLTEPDDEDVVKMSPLATISVKAYITPETISEHVASVLYYIVGSAIRAMLGLCHDVKDQNLLKIGLTRDFSSNSTEENSYSYVCDCREKGTLSEKLLRPSMVVFEIILMLETEVVKPLMDNKKILALLGGKAFYRILMTSVMSSNSTRRFRELVTTIVPHLSTDNIYDVVTKFFDYYMHSSVNDYMLKLEQDNSQGQETKKLSFRNKVLLRIATDKTIEHD